MVAAGRCGSLVVVRALRNLDLFGDEEVVEAVNLPPIEEIVEASVESGDDANYYGDITV